MHIIIEEIGIKLKTGVVFCLEAVSFLIAKRKEKRPQCLLPVMHACFITTKITTRIITNPHQRTFILKDEAPDFLLMQTQFESAALNIRLLLGNLSKVHSTNNSFNRLSINILFREIIEIWAFLRIFTQKNASLPIGGNGKRVTCCL
jgi:hypothetical protein